MNETNLGFLLDISLILLVFFHGLLAKVIKLYFFRKNVDRHIDGAAQSPPTLIIIQYCIETRAIAVEKILLSLGVYNRISNDFINFMILFPFFLL